MDIVLRASVMFAVVFVLLRLMGKRELAEMTPFELVLLVVIGDLLQQGVTHNDFSLTGASLAIFTFAFWTLVLNFLSNKSQRAEKVRRSALGDHRERQAAARQPRAQPADGLRGRERNAACGDRPRDRRRLGDSRDQRQDQLYQDG
jgi:hypothetical protein